MSYFDDTKEKAKTNPLEAGADLTKALMRWSTNGRLGYGLGSALISAQETLELTDRQVAAVADRVVAPLLKAARELAENRDRDIPLSEDTRAALVDFGENPFLLGY